MGLRERSGRTPDLIRKAFEWATHAEPEVIKADVQKLRSKHPHARPDELAKIIIRRTRVKTAAIGVATGVPSNPWTSGSAGILDAGVVLKMHFAMVARIAECYLPDFLDDPAAQTELLVPLFGANVATQALREGAMLKGMGLTRQAIRKKFKGDVLKALRKALLKYFGRKVVQKTVITKTVIVVGSLVGGGWNFAETSLVGARTIKYFQGEPLL
jgi:hypothetical protein